MASRLRTGATGLIASLLIALAVGSSAAFAQLPAGMGFHYQPNPTPIATAIKNTDEAAKAFDEARRASIKIGCWTDYSSDPYLQARQRFFLAVMDEVDADPEVQRLSKEVSILMDGISELQNGPGSTESNAPYLLSEATATFYKVADKLHAARDAAEARILARLNGLGHDFTPRPVPDNCPPPITEHPVGGGSAGGEGGKVSIATDSTVWCHFRPSAPYAVPVPATPDGGPTRVDPGPCPHCGLPGGPDSAGSCPNCGEPVAGPTPAKAPTPDGQCPHCGEPHGVKPGATGPCGFCGEPVAPPAPGPVNGAGGPAGGGGVTVTGLPPSTSAPPPAQPTGPVVVLINVKATSSAIAAGQNAVQVPGQQIKLFPTATANMPLPGPGVAKDTSTGAGSDPVQGTTSGPNNTVQLKADASTLGLNPGQYPVGGLTIDLNIDPTQAGIIVSGAGLTPTTPLNGYQPSQAFSINGKLYAVFYMPADDVQKVMLIPGLIVEINFCRTKEPLPPGKVDQAADARSALPGAMISLPANRLVNRAHS